MIDFNKFTQQAQNTVMNAQEVMQRFQNNQLAPEHLLLAIIEDEKNIGHAILQKLNVDLVNMKKEVEA